MQLNRSTIDGSTLHPPLPPHIQPPYYGALIAAEAIGPSGSAQVVEIQVNNDYIAVYAFYEGGVLVRALLINSRAYLKDAVGNRGSVHIDFGLTGNGTAPSFMSLKRLSISWVILSIQL